MILLLKKTKRQIYLKTEDEFTNSGTDDFIYFEFTY